MKLSLRLSSIAVVLLLLVAGCANPYKHLSFRKSTVHPGASLLNLKPKLSRDVYHCVIDGKFLFKKFHLSGVLLIKEMENKHTRAVFSNEMGISFFDFEWDKNDSFSVNQIIPQLDKPGLIKTLKKDFSLIMMKGIDTSKVEVFNQADVSIFKVPLERGNAYYTCPVTNWVSDIDIVGRSVVTSIKTEPAKKDRLPETILIKHHKAHFTIQLTKIDNNASE